MRTFAALLVSWRRVRVAEGARLESVYTGNRIGGSNPPVSAKKKSAALQEAALFLYLVAQWDRLVLGQFI